MGKTLAASTSMANPPVAILHLVKIEKEVRIEIELLNEFLMKVRKLSGKALTVALAHLELTLFDV